MGKVKVNPWLLPLSTLWGAGVNLRNYCFDRGWLKQTKFDVPIINVGNLAVGGTGKTPHTEYLIRLLKDRYRVAVLSRGYKRHTKGFVLATPTSSVFDIGDEPWQINRKFPDITVAVCEKRVVGVQQLLEMQLPPEVILLDDAYQHRYICPKLNILLMEYNRLPSIDYLLPAGRLREHFRQRKRADIVIVTKCPGYLMPMDVRVVRNELQLYTYQHLFFTTIEYSNLVNLQSEQTIPLSQLAKKSILLVSGIANPAPLQKTLAENGAELSSLVFADHHEYSAQDMERIQTAFAALPAESRCIVTTEKDAARLKTSKYLTPELRESIYVLPIAIKFLQNQEKKFNQLIEETVYAR